MPELLPLTARLRCGCLDAVPALAGREDHHRGAEPTRQRYLREERVLQHLHDNEAGPAHDVPRVYSLHGDSLVSTVPFRLSDRSVTAYDEMSLPVVSDSMSMSERSEMEPLTL